MRRIPRWALVVACIAIATPATAGVPTPHRISFQGLARNSSNQPVVSGGVRVRIYDAATAGTLVYDSGSEFNAAVATGVFNVLLGGGTPLLLDATKQYHLELDVNGQEIIGDAAAGRQAFWPAGGDLSRPDLESRIQALEALVFAECGPGQFDLNGNPADGCEFTLDPSGIYVDPADPAAADDASCGLGPAGTGGGNHPCQTITQGLTRATSVGRSNVYVANGTYAEPIGLVNGKNLFGGYRTGTWERQLSATNTILRGESASGNHRRAVVGSGITSPTTVEGFVIFGPNVTGTSGNSYGVHLTNCGGLVLRSNVIIGGVGGPGNDGSAGGNGTDGVGGTAGASAIQSPTSSCSSALDRSGGAGGSLTCSVTNVSGGAGGGNRCTPTPNSEVSGFDGTTATGGGGTGGDAGDDGLLQAGVFTTPPASYFGANGGNGIAGSNGSAGSGASSGVGSAGGGNWLGASGNPATAGGFGRGGGGGGAGGGADGINPERDVLGGAGGGGGSGACGGGLGGGGGAGGGSIGVFITTGAPPTITSCTFLRGLGGAGGRGGSGGRGGLGGLGAAGGLSSFLGGGFGGKGGDGGAGGHGGGGGGGAGGISCGIFTSGIGSPSYASGNAFSGGAGGVVGPGGLSLGSAGAPGVAGSITIVTSQ